MGSDPKRTFHEDPAHPGVSYRHIIFDFFQRRTSVGHIREAFAIIAPGDFQVAVEAKQAHLGHRLPQLAASLSHRMAARYGIDRATWITENNRF
ncbi:hypothetical protein JCM10212_001412 [Sporobolomyces blumeae]